MENKQAEKPKMNMGTWENISTAVFEKKPSVEFEINIPQIVTMQCDKPREINWEGGVFYVFDVSHKGENKSIKTSAWSLIRGLKAQEPLNGRTLKIEKKMIKGKQAYVVERNEEKVK